MKDDRRRYCQGQEQDVHNSNAEDQSTVDTSCFCLNNKIDSLTSG